MRHLPFALALALALPWPAQAGEAGGVEAVSLTIYNQDMAVVKETRPFKLDSGVQTLVLSDVSGMLRPETVHLKMPEHWGLSLLEQNFDFDLVNSSKLLQKFIGRQIKLVDDYNKTERLVTLLSVADGMVVAESGRVLLNPPGRVELPEGAADELLLRPTLSWLVNSPKSGDASAEISYLSGGLSWNADYVMALAADDKTAGLDGWVTINNNSGTTYKDAELKLVAGDVHTAPPPSPVMYKMAEAAPAGRAADGFAEESFFEYHLYDLQRPCTVKNAQQKQIGLLSAPEVKTKKLYLFDGQNGGDVRVMMQFKNSESEGLGMPLPAGVVRMYKADSEGDLQLIGEDRIEHTPKDEELRLYAGNAFDIKGEAVQTDYKDLGKGYSQSYKVTLRNHKESEDAVITVQARLSGDWRIMTSNYDYVKKDASTVEFQVPVKAGGESSLEYRYEVHWR